MKNFTKRIINLFPFLEKYLTDVKARTELFLKLGLTVNVGFATYNLFTGAFYRSIWFGGVAIYYVMICLIKFFLIIKGFELSPDTPKEYKNLFISGIMLLVLNITITVLVYQMILQNKVHSYSESVIVVSAGYTLFRLSAAAVDTVKLRKLNSPTLYASKALSLSVALMSLFSLQTSILDNIVIDSSLRRGLNIITGSAVVVLVVVIAIRVILKAIKNTKKPPK